MDPREWYVQIHKAKDLEFWGTKLAPDPDDDIVYVRYVSEMDDALQTHAKCVYWGIPFIEIGKHAWETWNAILRCQRLPDIMMHLTRIVGYYSFTRAWNLSKQAELRDRHKGNYEVTSERASTARFPSLPAIAKPWTNRGEPKGMTS
jgi:hypothetical protein